MCLPPLIHTWVRNMGNRTPLFDQHVAAGAKMVDFGGWDMPLHYGSQIDEHHAVRRQAGVFDVSHMTVVDIAGAGSTAYLRAMLANDVAKLSSPGRGLYSCMLTDSAGVVDDLIVYRTGPQHWRLVVNAATRDKDLAWLRAGASGFDLELTARPGGVMLAVQGPAACATAAAVLPPELREQALALKAFHCCAAGGWFIGRTGYTGEDGWEIIVDDPGKGVALWNACVAAGIQPCGLGARDTLRLEAGLALYGQDLDEQTDPLAAGLGWTVAWEPQDRQFCGREALERIRTAGTPVTAAGLVLEDRGIMRHGQRVVTDAGEGIITSGGFSPTLQRSIALARLPAGAAGVCQVEIRGSLKTARIVAPVFVRRGKTLIDISAHPE